MMPLTVALIEVQGGANLSACEGDVGRRRWWARRLGSASQVTPPERRDLVHGAEQGGPDAGSGFQKARLCLYECGRVPSAGRGLIIFRAAPDTT